MEKIEKHIAIFSEIVTNCHGLKLIALDRKTHWPASRFEE